MKVFLAKQIARYYHRNQIDLGGEPYVNHLIRVYRLTKEHHSKKYQIVAILHDLYEDTNCSPKLIKFLFGCEIHRAILVLTKTPGLKYDHYIQNVKHNKIANAVKQMDLLDNMDLTRLKKITDRDLKRNEKYKKSLDTIQGK